MLVEIVYINAQRGEIIITRKINYFGDKTEQNWKKDKMLGCVNKSLCVNE